MKLPVRFFCRRIFNSQKTFSIINNVLIVIIMLWTLAFFLAEVLVCGAHPEILWTIEDRSECVDQGDLNLLYAVIDAALDIMVIVMPYPCIRKLQMNNRQKLGVSGIFLLGTLSTVAALLRLGFICEAYKKSFGSPSNRHAAGTPPNVWSTVEAGLGVLAACLPPCGPLLRKAPDPETVTSSLAQRYREVISSGVHKRKESHELSKKQYLEIESAGGQRGPDA